MDHVMGGGAGGTLPVLRGVPDTRGNRPNGIYIPRFRNLDTRERGFLRGYGFQGGASLSKWGHANSIPGFGAEFKRRVKAERPWSVYLGGFGECLPRFENHCRLDTERVDAWGIPILHISAAFGDNERRMVADMADTAMEMLEAAGAGGASPGRRTSHPPDWRFTRSARRAWATTPPPSVLNRWQQAHEVRNLFVMDGSVYPSSACQNPTLTMMALAARACDYLVEEYRASRV